MVQYSPSLSLYTLGISKDPEFSLHVRLPEGVGEVCVGFGRSYQPHHRFTCVFKPHLLKDQREVLAESP